MFLPAQKPVLPNHEATDRRSRNSPGKVLLLARRRRHVGTSHFLFQNEAEDTQSAQDQPPVDACATWYGSNAREAAIDPGSGSSSFGAANVRVSRTKTASPTVLRLFM